MKKFLTVLLALSVVFTYTVGTAFAGTTYDATDQAKAKATTEQNALADVVKEAKGKLAYLGTGYLSTIDGTSVVGTNGEVLSSSAVDAAIAELVTDVYNQKIYDKAIELAKDGTFSDEDATAVENAWKTDIDAYGKVLQIAFEYEVDTYTFVTALKKQFAIDKTAAETYLKGIDTTGYSTVEYFKTNTNTNDYIDISDRPYTKGVSESSVLAAYMNTQKDALDAIKVSGDPDADADAIDDIRDLVADVKDQFKSGADAASDFFDKYADADHAYFMSLADRIAALTTSKTSLSKDMEAKAQKFEETSMKELSDIIMDAGSTEKEKDQAKARYNSIVVDVARLMASYNERVDAVAINNSLTPKMAYDALEAIKAEYADTFDVTQATGNDYSGFDDALDNIASINSLVDYANEIAATMKKTYADGSTELKYSEEVVNTVLNYAIQKIKAGDLNTKAGIKGWMYDQADTLSKAEVGLAAARMEALNNLDAILGDYPDADYNDAAYGSLGRLDAITALRTKAIADVKAAAKVREIVDIMDTFEKAMAAYLTDDECDAVVAGKAAAALADTDANPTTYANSYAALVNADVDAFFVGKTGYGNAVIDGLKASIKEELKVAVCGLGKINSDVTNAEALDAMKKAYNKVFAAETAKVKTDAEIDAAAKNVIDLIAAIDTPVTQASRDKIDAAQAAYDAYKAIPGGTDAKITNLNVLEAAGNRLLALDKSQIATAVVKLANKTITVEDKAAVDELLALEDAYEKYWGEPSPYIGSIEDIQEDYIQAVVQDFINKASALPVTVTLDDRASVETAQAAYDELVAQMEGLGYSEEFIEAYLKNTYGQMEETNFLKSYLKLNDAKVQLKQAEIQAVESLKIVASSKLYKGKKIQVKWRIAGGNPSTIDGYRVYKSTKAQSGYKFMGKTKKLYMDNKKGLMKGKRYFYKVRAYKVVDGKTYYSDYSNKANRIYK